MIKRVFKIVFIVAVAIILVIAIFKVRIINIEVIGNTKVQSSEIISEIFKRDYDKTSILFFIKDKTKKHEKIKYIDDYSVEWITPFSIKIRVRENPAIAFTKRDLKKVYFDKDGIINEILDEQKGDLIEVVGISFKTYEKGEKIATNDEKVVNAILNITSSLYEEKLPANLLEIDKKGNFLIYINDIVVYLGDTQNMEIKLQRLYDIYKEISDRSGVLDLSNARENMLDEQYIFKKN